MIIAVCARFLLFFLCAFFYVSFSFFYVLLLTKHDAFRGRSMEFRIKGKGREVSFAILCISRRFADTALQLIVRIKLRNVFSTLCFKLWEWPNCRIGPRFIASGQARARDEDERECKRKGGGGKEEEQFVFRAMAAFCAVHIIYVLTSFNFIDYRITRKL